MSNARTFNTDHLVEYLFREQSGKMSAILTRRFGFSNAELIDDIIQETFIAALKTWSLKGVPEKPEAWLFQVAKNKTLNELKKQAKLSYSEEGTPHIPDESEMDDLFMDNEIKDSQLRLLYACCNPVLSEKVQVILTLKSLCGFSVHEIAHAFLMKKEAVKKTITRARQTLADIPVEVPFIEQAKSRTEAVQLVLYLMFNEGYKASVGDDLINEQLCYDAVRLAKLVTQIPEIDDHSTYALLALMYFNMSRFDARMDEHGEMIQFQLQDRATWNKAMIGQAFSFLEQSRKSTGLNRYHIEAGIAAAHASAPTFEKTSWKTIVDYYRLLFKFDQSPVTHLNYAIAMSLHEGPERGLEELSTIKAVSMQDYFLFHASKADMYFRLHDFERAKSYYQVALDLADSKPDQTFIRKKMLECDTKNITPN